MKITKIDSKLLRMLRLPYIIRNKKSQFLTYKELLFWVEICKGNDL
jgi:hypothetical protein